MKNELLVLKKLKSVIEEEFNYHLEEGLDKISEANVHIEFPDTDQMPRNTMLYIQPNWADYEAFTTESDSSTLNIAVFIICKKDRTETLTTKIYGYFNALYSLLKDNSSLDGMADFCDIENADFYPAVEGNRNVQAVEVSVSIRYTKDF